MENVNQTTVEEGLVITRIFNAPVKLVWQAWTDPKHVMQWWGPKNFTAPVAKIDLKVGGKYLFCMRSGDGTDFWVTGNYREIVPYKKLVWTDCFSDKDGNMVSGETYGMKGLPLEMECTLTLEEIGGKTKMTLCHVGIPKGETTDMTNAGWNESFDKMATSLTK